MSQAASPSTDKPYGLSRVLRVWEKARSTFYHQRHAARIEPTQTPIRRRPGPVGPCDDATLVEHIRVALHESPFHGEGYRKLWAKLRHKGLRTSKERVRRLMREQGLQAPTRVGNPHGPRAHDRTILTERPNMMWGTDMTTTITTDEGQACVFVAIDHCTAECVGIHASRSGNRFEALEPIRQATHERFGGFAQNIATGLSIRHDHGSAYMSEHFQQELNYLGMASSPAFVREPEGNGCAERFIRTLKENLLWVRHFTTIEELRQALLEFKERYNRQWLIQRHGYRTPAQARKAFEAGQRMAA